jgi:site-specific DNA recombinase
MAHRIRCAIYTRKSTEEGLDQDFNSLDAQREACEAYIASQKAEGWTELNTRYDDGGLSGATLERPALQRLLKDIAAGKVDQIVVYKIDRLTRSLSDFAKIIDRLDAAQTSFVSVTQSFNTATSMGRLTLNMLLSFAQFEREVTAERIRDKITASKRKGMWMGGRCPLGYAIQDRALVIHEQEAETIRLIYTLYEQKGSVSAVRQEMDDRKLRTRSHLNKAGDKIGNNPFSRGHVYHILTNPIYAGRIRHGKLVYDGRHEALIEPARWDQIQTLLQTSGVKPRGKPHGKPGPSLLAGKLFDATGDRLTPTHTTRKGKRHRYYVSRRLIVDKAASHKEAWRLPAQPLEEAVFRAVQDYLQAPERPAQLLPQAPADMIAQACQILSHPEGLLRQSTPASWPQLIQRIIMNHGRTEITLDPAPLACLLKTGTSLLCPKALTIILPLSLRRKGVETRLVTGAITPSPDPVLINTIALAHQWYAALKQGEPLQSVAKNHGCQTSRIRQMIELIWPFSRPICSKPFCKVINRPA